MQKAKEFLISLISGIVRNPGDLKIEASQDSMGILLRVWANKDDMGLIIGRGGVHANAIKLLTKLYGFRRDLRISVKIEEPKE